MLSRIFSSAALAPATVPGHEHQVTPRKPRRAVASWLVFSALLVPLLELGCAAQYCTAIGCLDGLRVDLTPTSGWKMGSYRFDIEIDGVVTTCEGSLPLKPCTGGPSLQCTPAGQRVVISESGCALPTEQHGFSQVSISDTAAKSVTIKVSRDGTPLVSKTLAPRYITSEPNGPGCPSTCTNASEMLVIPGAA